MNTYFSLFFWAVFIATVFSPPDPMLEDSIIPFCATNELLEKQLNDDLDLPKKLNEFEVKWQSHLQQNGGDTENSPEYILPVVVHIIHENGDENIPDNQVLQAIEFLNDAFANINYYDQNTGKDTQIQFCLAIQDPDKNSTNGINRVQSSFTNLSMIDDVAMKNTSRWEPKDYINIWVVKEICNTDGNCNVAGYAYLPYTHGSLKDGIVIEHTLFGEKEGKTGALIHEMGHYLGLYHTFQGGCTNGNCAVQGDRICDTPPDQSTASVPCDGSINTCDTDINSGFSTDQNDMFWNYMDYGDLNCFSAFTPGQIDRMHFSIENLRASLLESVGCQEPCPVNILADFEFSNLNIELGETVTFINNSTFATDFEWGINGTFYSNEANPAYTFDQVGSFEINLIATGNGESCISKIVKTVEIVCNVDAHFDVGNENPKVGEIVQFSPVFAPDTDYVWTVNGTQISTNQVFDFTVPSEGIFDICLEAKDGNCTSSQCEKLFVFGNQSDCISPVFSKTFEHPTGINMEGHCIAASNDGKFHIAGKIGNNVLLITTDFSGNMLNSKQIVIDGGVKEIAQIIVDTDGNVYGIGTTLDEKAFYFNAGNDFDFFDWHRKLLINSEGVSIVNADGYFYIFVNTPESLDSDEGDYLMIKVEKSIGSIVVMSPPLAFSSAADEKLSSVTTDGEYFYVSTNFSSFQPGSVDYVGVIKIGLDGEPIWSKRSNGIDQKLVDIHYEEDAIYVLGEGISNMLINSAVVIKMNLNGTVQWKKAYNTIDEPSSLIPVEDGLLIQGKSTIKINYNGEEKWHKDYTQTSNDFTKINQITEFLSSVRLKYGVFRNSIK